MRDGLTMLPLTALVLAACVQVPAALAQQTLDDAALRDYAARPFDKAALVFTTQALGTYRGASLVAEFPCADVCPQYAVRIIHYRLNLGQTCASVGGVMADALVPVAITVRSKAFCVPKMLEASGRYFTR